MPGVVNASFDLTASTASACDKTLVADGQDATGDGGSEPLGFGSTLAQVRDRSAEAPCAGPVAAVDPGTASSPPRASTATEPLQTLDVLLAAAADGADLLQSLDPSLDACASDTVDDVAEADDAEDPDDAGFVLATLFGLTAPFAPRVERLPPAIPTGKEAIVDDVRQITTTARGDPSAAVQVAQSDQSTAESLAELLGSVAEDASSERRRLDATLATAVGGQTVDAAFARVDDAFGASPLAPSATLHRVAAADVAPTAPADSVLQQRELRAYVGTQQWNDELAAQLVWLKDAGLQSASLRLNPEHLGPVEVRIDVRNDQSTVWFSAANGDTRSALEQALPRLRELFASQGLALADAGVFHEPPRDTSRPLRALAGRNAAEISGVSEATAVEPRRLRGLVDLYA